MDRRRLLATLGVSGAALGAAGLLDACTSGSSGTASPTASGSIGTTGAPPLDPRAAAAAVETRLHDQAADVLARFPATAATIVPVRDAHAAHVLALVGTTPSPTATATASVASTPPRGAASAALRALAAQEGAAALEHGASASRSDLDGADARLIASIAAFAAAQDVVLTDEAR